MQMAAAGPASPRDRVPMMGPAVIPIQTPPAMVSDAFAKNAILGWFRGEFAAANAIIDALCGHLAQLSGEGAGSEYESVFVAIHRRRLNWIPVLQMQKYHSIADVAVELQRVAEGKLKEEKKGGNETKKSEEMIEEVGFDEKEKISEKMMASAGNDGDIKFVEENVDSPHSHITDSGCEEMHDPCVDNIDICSNHEDCNARPSHFKLIKGFSAKERVKGHMVNVVKGLKLYEDVFTTHELSKLSDFVNELRLAGHNGQLSGETFILFNQQMKGHKKELIQLGIPIFGHIKEEATKDDNQTSNIEPIPTLLQGVIDHLVQWQIIPEYKKPNGCIIHFFDEEEYSQPFLKPPHLDQPISTLLLSESSVVFGRTIVNDSDGNYRGPLVLSLKEGSLLVMRGNSADMSRHVMCQSPNKRVSITFFRVRPNSNQGHSPPASPLSGAMTFWQPGIPSPFGALSGYEAMDTMSKWGVLGTPVVMLAPMRPMVLSPKRMPRGGGGTGVFLPWSVGSRKLAKRLPPRAQKGRLLALPSPIGTRAADTAPEISTSVDANSA